MGRVAPPHHRGHWSSTRTMWIVLAIIATLNAVTLVSVDRSPRWLPRATAGLAVVLAAAAVIVELA